MHIITRNKFSKKTRQIMILMMIVAGIVMSGVMSVAAAPVAQTSVVSVLVEDTNGTPIANQVVYAFDGTGTVYQNISATTGPNGEAAVFNLSDGDYLFRADDVNGTQYFTSTICTVPTCTAVTLTMPVMGPVDVTVEDANGPIANQVVYAFDGTGTSYTGLSATTGPAGEAASFTLPAGDYLFRSDDINGTQYFTTTVCDVPNCTAVTLTMPVMGAVVVTVEDANGPIAGQVVYAFDGTGTSYTGLSATTGPAGEAASFTLPAGDYLFRSDDVNGTQYFTTTVCDVPNCTAVTLTMPVMGPVDVTVQDANGLVANQIVYAFDGTGTTYTGLSATTGPAGEVASFILPAGDYLFRSDDVNGTQYFTTTVCDVPNCTAVTLTMDLVGLVDVTVEDANGPIANQVVYAFDSSGTTYTGLSATTGPVGEPAAFQLPYGDYLFRADDANGTQYFTTTVCDVPNCTAVTLTMPVMGPVDVTVEDANGPIANQVVYAFDGTGTTYTGLSATTGPAGEVASFILPAGDYLFRSDDINGTQYFTATVCDVPNCTAVTLTMPVVEVVEVTVNDLANNPLANQIVYAFDGTIYTGLSSVTDDAGLAVFNLPAGSYRFATDVYGVRHYSDTVNHCTIPGCATATLTVQATTLPAATCTETSPGNRTCDLWATTGSLLLPDGSSVPIWGYTDSATGSAQLPGPTLIVNEGETITINLTNLLGENVSMYFPGIPMMPDLMGATANGGTTSYTFVAADPGTYRYEAGLLPNAQHQVAMGLFGALIVRPSTAGQAYGSPVSAFDDEALLILSEIDPALNNSTDPATFNMHDFTPKYWLINGRAFPQTQLIPTIAGHNVLLRYINAGFQHHTMSLMGLDQMLIAEDGYPLPFQRSVVAEAIMIGQTRDMIVNLPAATPGGSYLALYDASMLLHNNNEAGFGGMMTFLTTAAGPAGPDVAGPSSSAVTVTPDLTDGTVNALLTATVSDVATGNANIQAAEYYIDDTNGTPAAMTATDGAFDSPLEAVEATIPAAAIAALSPGDHLIYVRGQDALGNWGSFNLVTLRLELAGSGPETHGLTFTPNPSAGDVIVTLSGTGDDSATGNSNIVDAEFFVGAPGADGSGTHMAINLNEPIASIDYGFTTTDLSGLGEGVHTVYVHSKDDFAWGAMATIDLEIDLSGPDTTGVVIAPNPNNGTLPINPSLYAARLDATLTDPLNASVRSNLYQAEFFIGTTGPDGTGIPMYARDGLFDSPTEEAYALISLVNINALGPGSHTIYVHGRDASGNWGPLSSTVLLIQQDAPTVSGTAATPNPTNGVTAVDLTAVANDAGADITLAEWFVDADPGPGNGTAMTISGAANPWNLSATIDITGWADGAYTLYVRVQDAAGNWSAVDSTILTVAGTPPPPPPPTPAQLHFSTLADAAIPGVAGPYDDADVYLWDTNTASFSRVLDGSALGLPGNADIDGLAIDPVTGIYYVSFANNSGTNVPLIGLVQDEDVVLYDPGNGEWQTFFQGGDACGLNASNAQDLDAIDYVGGVLYFSTIGNQPVNGAAGPYDDADIYSWTDGGGCNRVFDASTAGLLSHADIDGLVVTGVDQFYFSFNRDGGTTVPSLGAVQDEDVVQYDAGTWSLFFDGAAQGLNTSNGQDLDAIEIP